MRHLHIWYIKWELTTIYNYCSIWEHLDHITCKKNQKRVVVNSAVMICSCLIFILSWISSLLALALLQKADAYLYRCSEKKHVAKIRKIIVVDDNNKTPYFSGSYCNKILASVPKHGHMTSLEMFGHVNYFPICLALFCIFMILLENISNGAMPYQPP